MRDVTPLLLLVCGLALGPLGCPAASQAPPGPSPATIRAEPPKPALPPSPVAREPAGDCRRAAALATRAERLGEATERVHVLEQAVGLCDGDAALLRDLALAYRDAGDRESARQSLLRARAIAPSDPSIAEALDTLDR